MNRKTVIAAFVTLILILVVNIAVAHRANANNPSETLNEWLSNLHDSLDQGKSRRTTVSVLRKSKSFQFIPEELSMRLSYGVTFRFHNESGGLLIVYLHHPSTGEAFLDKKESQLRLFACQRYGPPHGIEIMPGSKEERRLLELVRTASRPPHQQDVQLVLHAIENRTFDWSLWRGFASR